MRGSISLHPKHGVNPSLETCFACGRDTGAILLLGNNRGREAPHKTCTGNLCPDCQGAVDKGAVLLIEVKDGEAGKKDPWRTGFMIGVRREAIEESAIGKSPIAYVEEKDLRAILGPNYDKIKKGAEDAETDQQAG